MKHTGEITVPSAYTTTVSVNSFYSETTAYASIQRIVVWTWIEKLGGTRQPVECNTPQKVGHDTSGHVTHRCFIYISFI
jgi:hypothetical protein